MYITRRLRQLSPEMEPLLPWHSARLRQVPESPLFPVHSELGKVTTWNKLQTHVLSCQTLFRNHNYNYLKNLSLLVLFPVLILFEIRGITGCI